MRLWTKSLMLLNHYDDVMKQNQIIYLCSSMSKHFKIKYHMIYILEHANWFIVLVTEL